MNKQEAIEKVRLLKTRETFMSEMVWVKQDDVIDIISQINEPQKVAVPEFIDSFIRYAKSEGMSLFIAMDNAQNKESKWIIKNEETFTRAWFDGYEVEKEKRYCVKARNVYHGDLGFYALYNSYSFYNKNETSGIRYDLTREELVKAGLREVFDNPMFKVVEVE